MEREDTDLKYEIETAPSTYRDPWRIRKLVFLGLNVPKNEEIVQLVQKNHKRATRDSEPRVRAHASSDDAAHLWKTGSKTTVYGPSSDAGRFPNAYVEIEKMVTCTKVLALTALDICRKVGS